MFKDNWHDCMMRVGDNDAVTPKTWLPVTCSKRQTASADLITTWNVVSTTNFTLRTSHSPQVLEVPVVPMWSDDARDPVPHAVLRPEPGEVPYTNKRLEIRQGVNWILNTPVVTAEQAIRPTQAAEAFKNCLVADTDRTSMALARED